MTLNNVMDIQSNSYTYLVKSIYPVIKILSYYLNVENLSGKELTNLSYKLIEFIEEEENSSINDLSEAEREIYIYYLDKILRKKYSSEAKISKELAKSLLFELTRTPK